MVSWPSVSQGAGTFVRISGTHATEHAIEVQLPLLQVLLPEAAIVPISVRPGSEAEEVGHYCGGVVADRGGSIAFVGSTDLTQLWAGVWV